MDLKQIFAARLATGLRRQSVTSPSRWAEQYRMMGGSFAGPWSFKHYPWLKEMHDSKAEMNIGQKGAQLGFTDLCINLVGYKMDIEGVDCLYLLPNKVPDAADFSAARFDVALELSPHLKQMFSDTKNVGHKRAGKTNLYIRGSQAKAGLRSIPVGFIIIDERSIMNQENIELALERTSGQLQKQVWQISTPTTEDENINREYNLSTQEEFFFKCPSCSRSILLTFPESFVVVGDSPTDPRIVESHLICNQCKAVLPHETKGDWLANNEWVPRYPDRLRRGFHVNQLYSPTVTPKDIAESFLKSKTSAAAEQEFYNSKLGLTHAVSGARLSVEEILECKGSHSNSDRLARNSGKLVTMGIDVGNWCHFEVNEWTFPSHYYPDAPETALVRVLRQGKVQTFADLDSLVEIFQPHGIVIDRNPEHRMARAFCMRWYGRAWMCEYHEGVKGKDINESSDPDEPRVGVDRTSWMDLALGRFRQRTISIPCDASLEYSDNLKAPVRIPLLDKNGNHIARYENGTKPDHHAHARTYAEIAMPLALARGRTGNTKVRT